MGKRLLALCLCGAPGLCLAQPAGIGESAPLRGAEPAPRGTPVQQVLARVDSDAAGSLSELQAGEIESVLDEVASELVAGTLRWRDRIAPTFRGTALAPASEQLSHSQGGLETLRGTPQSASTVTADTLADSFDAWLAAYR